MRSTEINLRMPLLILAAVCLLVSGALSMPADRGMGMHGHGKMVNALNNVNPEELGNMTLGEIKEMEENALNGSFVGQNCGTPGGLNCNAVRGGRMPFDGQMNADGGPNMMGWQSFPAGSGGSGFLGCGSTALLLMDDISIEELGDMSLNEILALNEKKMQELDNMTLNDIHDLWQKKAQAQSNMTLNQLINETRDMQAKEGIIGWVSTQYSRLVA